MKMSNNLKRVRLALVTGYGFLALSAHAGEALPEMPRDVAERCLNAMGMQDMQPMREMAKAMSPEVILDRVFSAVAPDYQKALLSKPSSQAKGPEAMRDQKYFLPAIAIMEMPFNLIRVRADGQVIEPAASGSAKPDPNWAQMTDNPQKKPLASVLPAPQRY